MPRVLTLDKSLSVLETVFSSREGIGTRTLAQILDLNVATAHNIARTFCERGYLRQDAQSKVFYPGVRLKLFGRHPSYLRALSLSAATIVDRVAKKLNESVLLASIEQGHIINLKYVPSQQALRVHESEDMSDHSYATAVGKILLSSLGEAELDIYLQKMPLQAFTSHTITDIAQLKQDLARIREQKYAQTRDEFCEGLSAVAVPICDPWQTIVAGIGASAPTFRLQKASQLELTLKELRQAAAAIEQQWTETPQAEPEKKPAPKAKASRAVAKA